MLLAVGDGEGGEGTDVGGRLSQHDLHRRELTAELAGDGVATAAASGWAKTVRMAAATISWEPFGTRARTFPPEMNAATLPGGAQHHLLIEDRSPSWAS